MIDRLSLAFVVVAALAAPATAVTLLSNTTLIKVPGTGTEGPASPFPSTIRAAGLVGTLSGLTIDILDFSHTRANDVGIGLIAPNGTGIWLFNGTGDGHSVSNMNVTFSDAGTAKLVLQTVSGTYKPGTKYTGTSLFPVGTPLVTTLAGFSGIDPNGVWQLFVRDYASSYAGQPGVPGKGQIAGGFSLSFQTLAAVPELASWALLVSGFAVLGFALRRRRSLGVVQA